MLILSSVAAIFTDYLGGWDLVLQSLITIVVIDLITAILKSILKGCLNYKDGAKWLIKRIGYFLLVVVAVITDQILGNTEVIRNTLIYFFIAKEGLSILENWKSMGLDVPKILLDTLKKFKTDNK